MKHVRSAAVASALALTMTASALPAAVAEPASGEVVEYTGTIDGADFGALVPDDWNGTLVLFAHGYFPTQFAELGFEVPDQLANNPRTEEWLTGQGYALAGSMFGDDGFGYTLPDAVDHQENVMDWFTDEIGEPDTTLVNGQSFGGAIAALHAEQDRRVDGVLGTSAGFDPLGGWDAALDVQYAAMTLLFDDLVDENGNPVEIVNPTDPQASQAALTGAAYEALGQPEAFDPEANARLALAGSLVQVPAWFDFASPRPEDPLEAAHALSEWVVNAYLNGHGPADRAHIAETFGGNPSTNAGVDYHALFRRSVERRTVEAAYEAAGLGEEQLRADLDALDAGARYDADPVARARMAAHTAPGDLDVPILTVHATGDGGAPAADVRSYTDHVRAERGDIRNLWIARGGHPTVTAAEEIVAIQALQRRVRTGTWPPLNPRAMGRSASALPSETQVVATWDENFETIFVDTDAAFTRYVPPRAPRATY
jgi:pimeloyl-ACP methyl ester carboxylesterase